MHSQGRRKGVFSDDLRKSKVTQFDRQFLVRHQDILWLDVSMDDPSFMLRDQVVSWADIHRR